MCIHVHVGKARHVHACVHTEWDFGGLVLFPFPSSPSPIYPLFPSTPSALSILLVDWCPTLLVDWCSLAHHRLQTCSSWPCVVHSIFFRSMCMCICLCISSITLCISSIICISSITSLYHLSLPTYSWQVTNFQTISSVPFPYQRHRGDCLEINNSSNLSSRA